MSAPCLPRCRPPSWADGTANRRACTHDAGEGNKAVCRELDLAEATVKNHITAILRALKVTNRHQGRHRGRGVRMEAENH